MIKFPHKGDCICPKCLKVLLSPEMQEEVDKILRKNHPEWNENNKS